MIHTKETKGIMDSHLLTSAYETQLIKALQPIRFYSLAINLYHLFETGLYDALAEAGQTVEGIVERHGMDADRVEVFLKYLRNEGILEEDDGKFTLSKEGRDAGIFRPWYTLLMGGYAETLLQIGAKLQSGSGPATRDVGKVGAGSCEINRLDTIPLTRDLMAMVPGTCSRLLDMGCGNGRYLVDFCQALPEIKEAWGVEPSEAGAQEAQALVAQNGLQDRIRIVCSSAADFLDTNSNFDYEPDFVVLGFVLHEILGQEGEDGVVHFLSQLITRYPKLHMIVIEVDLQIDTPRLMQHGLAQAFYNIYYLLHPFTTQRLEPLYFWEQLFAKCQLEIMAKESPNILADSTGLIKGYLLRKCQSA